MKNLPMPVPRVTTRDWRSEVLAADAAMCDECGPGPALVNGLLPYQWAYEFSNGRRFADCRGSYVD